ncbi:FMN reductase [Aquincola sp. MAHUQ-54]|uniref:FMN reductase n=1 Tax=Aquincola agrisoli TaxID=3119538 RepID=A0AAW9Q7X5_9BURK
MTTPHRITVVVGNTGERSRTKVLAQAIADALSAALPVTLQVLEIAKLAPHIGVANAPQDLSPEGAAALRAIETADLVVAVSPVYKGSYSGLFKHLFDLLSPDALVGRPVLLAANGGSDRHALVVDHQLRPLFAFFRALTVPSAVYAAASDFDGYVLDSEALRARIDEAVLQARLLLAARTPGQSLLREAA